MDIVSFIQNIQSLTESGVSLLLSHFLQALAFSIFISNLLTLILTFLGFAYAKSLSQSLIMKGFALLLMWYVKIWDHYSGLLYVFSVFSLTIVSIYVYDCCGNISERFDNWRINNRDWAIIGSFALMFTSTAFVFYSIYSTPSEKPKYDYSGIYLLIVLLILVGNMLRGRSVIYTLIGILIMNYLIGARYLVFFQTEDTVLKQIPLAVIPYFLMALDAQKRQQQKCKSQVVTNLFMTCAALSAYSLLNDIKFPLQLMLGGVFIFGLIINR